MDFEWEQGVNKFFNYNKHTTLVGDVDSGEDCECVRIAGIWELFVFTSHFSVNQKLL